MVVLCNLKPRNMRGIKSNGMLLCASNDAHDCVEPLIPPEAASIGERVFFEADAASQPAPESPNKVPVLELCCISVFHTYMWPLHGKVLSPHVAPCYLLYLLVESRAHDGISADL